MNHVTFETRIEPITLKARTHFNLNGDVLSCIRKDGIKIFKQKPYAHNSEFSNEWANIYHDHCIYAGDEKIGYFRQKEYVVGVNGLMLDFDSHVPTDMPLEEIGKVLNSPDFTAVVPFSEIVMTGNGYQVHFKVNFDFEKIESDGKVTREKCLAEFEAAIESLMLYFKDTWQLRCDENCNDINRNYRLPGSWNTKAVKQIGDESSRKKVELIAKKNTVDIEVWTWIKNIRAQYPTSIKPTFSESTIKEPIACSAQVALEAFLSMPCMKTLWEDGSGSGNRHDHRFVIMSGLYRHGCTNYDDLVKLLSQWNQRCDPIDDEQKIEREVSYFLNRPKMLGCRALYQTYSLCTYQHLDLKAACNECPFVTARRKKHPYWIGKEGNLMHTFFAKNQEGVAEAVHERITEAGHIIIDEIVLEERAILGVNDSTLYRGRVVGNGYIKNFEVPASVWGNANKFCTTMKGFGGLYLRFDPEGKSGTWRKIADAAEMLNDSKITRRICSFGWNENYTEYFGGNCVITKDGIAPPSDHYFRHSNEIVGKLGLVIPKGDIVVKTLRHIKDELLIFNSPQTTSLMLGTAFVAPFASYFRNQDKLDATNCVASLGLLGTTGDSKTTTAILGVSFFGNFQGADILTTKSTPLAITEIGYYFKDALFPVDDIKWNALRPQDQTQFTAMFQGYLDGSGRNRMNRNEAGKWDAETGKPIRGTLLITGEDFPEGESSVLSRIMMFQCPSMVRNTPLYNAVMSQRLHYPAVMAVFIQWFLTIPNHWQIITERFRKHLSLFESEVPKEQMNSVRVCSQLALNLIGFELFSRFLEVNGIITTLTKNNMVDEHTILLKSLRDKRMYQISDESAADKFLETLKSLVVAGKVKIDTSADVFTTDEDNRPGMPTIGFWEEDIIYINPDIALPEIQRLLSGTSKIPFGERAIGAQLKTQGYLSKMGTTRVKVEKRHKGSKQRYWAIDGVKAGFKENVTKNGKNGSELATWLHPGDRNGDA